MWLKGHFTQIIKRRKKKLNSFSLTFLVTSGHAECFGFIYQVLRQTVRFSTNSVLRCQLITQNAEINKAKGERGKFNCTFLCTSPLLSVSVVCQTMHSLLHPTVIPLHPHVCIVCQWVCVFCVCLLKWDLNAILLCLVHETPSEYVRTQSNTCKQCFCFFNLLRQIVAFSWHPLCFSMFSLMSPI